MAKLLFMRIGRPAPLRTALERLTRRVAALRVQEQRCAASDESGQDKQEEVVRGHAAAPARPEAPGIISGTASGDVRGTMPALPVKNEGAAKRDCPTWEAGLVRSSASRHRREAFAANLVGGLLGSKPEAG